jgi:hypothetical protein
LAQDEGNLILRWLSMKGISLPLDSVYKGNFYQISNSHSKLLNIPILN